MTNVVMAWDHGEGQTCTQYDDGTFVWSTPENPQVLRTHDYQCGKRCMQYDDGVHFWTYPPDHDRYPQYACRVLHTEGPLAGVGVFNDKYDGSVLWKYPTEFPDLPGEYTACKVWPDDMREWLTTRDSNPFAEWTNTKLDSVTWEFPPNHPQYQWYTVDPNMNTGWEDAQGNRYYTLNGHDGCVFTRVGDDEVKQIQQLVTREELDAFLAGDGPVEVNVYDPVDGGVMHADTHAIDRGNIRDNPGGRIELCSDTTDVTESAYDAPVHALTIDDESLTPNIYQDEVLVQINGRQHGWDVTERCGGGITSHIDVVPEASPVRTSFTVADLYNPNSGVRLVTHIDGEAIELKLVRGEKPKAPVIADDGRLYIDGRTHAAGPGGGGLGEDLAPGVDQVDQVDQVDDAVDAVTDDGRLDANPGSGRQWDRHGPLNTVADDVTSSFRSSSFTSSSSSDELEEVRKKADKSGADKWYLQPLWRMQLTELLMVVMDQLNGDIWDSVINYPFTGAQFDMGARWWDEVVGHLQAAQADSLRWSGLAAQKFTAQLPWVSG